MKRFFSILMIFAIIAAAHTAAFAAETPASLELNYTDAVVVEIGESPVPMVSVRALDANGEPVYGVKVNARLSDTTVAEVTAYSAVTDQNGYSAFSVDGIAPGSAALTFRAEGTDVCAEIPLVVSAGGAAVSRPVITVGGFVFGADAPKANSVTVPEGSLLSLDCATEGAVIYYNLNDTCPCQDLVSRRVYTEPIPITGDCYFRITAYKPGMEYSPRINLTVTAAPARAAGDVDGDGAVLASDARLALRISAKLCEPDAAAFAAADLDGDGNVTADEARTILRISAKLA